MGIIVLNFVNTEFKTIFSEKIRGKSSKYSEMMFTVF